MAEGVFTVRISPEKQRQLDALAQVLDRSRNWVVSDAIDQYLDVQAWQLRKSSTVWRKRTGVNWSPTKR